MVIAISDLRTNRLQSQLDHFFPANFPFSMRTMGTTESSTRVLIRKRPSRETAYSGIRLAPPPVATRVGNNATGDPGSNAPAWIRTDTAINFPSGAMKYNSLPSGRQRGSVPPAAETFDLMPGPGNGCTYISNRPVSLD